MADMSSGVDWLSRIGAELLAKRLDGYWREQGIAVHTWVEHGWLWHERDFYAVRSDLQLQLPGPRS